MPLYRVFLKSDNGRHRVVIAATDPQTAAALVCKAEGAPARVVEKVTEVKPRKTTAA